MSAGHTLFVTEPMVFESCHSTWVFDPDHLRFRRVLKGIEAEDRPIVTAWRPYYGLEVEEGSEAFTVLLNEEGTRMIRSWRHTGDCQQCGGHVTAEMSLDEISAVLA